MNLADQAYNDYVDDLISGTYGREKKVKKHKDRMSFQADIVPDGGIVRVGMMMMDSLDQTQQAVMSASAQHQLVTAQSRQDRIDAFRDHHDAYHQDAEQGAYGQMCVDLSQAWRNPS